MDKLLLTRDLLVISIGILQHLDTPFSVYIIQHFYLGSKKRSNLKPFLMIFIVISQSNLWC